MMIVLRLLHVVLGVFWAGAVFFIASFLLPSIRDSGPAGGAVMRQLGIRKYPNTMLTVATLTVLSGFGLYGMNVSSSNGAFARSTSGMVFGIGGAAALVSVIIGFTLITPTANKLTQLGAAIQASGGPPSAEQAAEQVRLAGRMSSLSRLAGALVGVAVIPMAIGRYL